MRKTLTKKQAQQVIWSRFLEELDHWISSETSWLNNLDKDFYTNKQIQKIKESAVQLGDKLTKLAGRK